MITIKELTLRNFLSYGNNTTTINLDRKGTTLIVGENLDDTANGVGANGVGKAQPLYSKVKVPGGWKHMGDMVVGDTIVTPNYEHAKVSGVFPQGVRPTYKITFEDGRTADADENHLWQVSYAGITKVVNTLELLDLLEYNVYVPTVNADACPDVELSEGPFAAGYSIGTLAHQSRHKPDVDIRIPNENFESSLEQRVNLLRGLSTYSELKGNNTHIRVSSEALANDIANLVRSVGHKASVEARTPIRARTTQRRHRTYSYVITFDSSVFSSQYTPTPLRVTNVEYIGDVETQCIMVDHPDHLYITDNYVVTHNTTIINAISYLFYDKPISKISKDNLVNNINGKNMEVSVTFTNGDGNEYRIYRARKMKAGAAGNTVQLHINGEDRSEGVDTNKRIERIIGIPYELFVRIVVFSATHVPFLDLPASHPTAPNQKSFIEELFLLTTLTEKSDLLKKQIKDNEASLAIKKSRVDALEGEQQRHLKVLESAQKRADSWYEQNQTTVDNLKKQYDKLSVFDFDAEIQSIEQLDKLEKALEILSESATKIKRARREDIKQCSELTSELDHLQNSKCPYCLQDFEGTASKIAEINTKLDNLEVVLSGHDEALKDLTEQSAAIAEEFEEVNKNVTYPNVNDVKRDQLQLERLQERIDTAESASNPHLDSLAELKELVLDGIDYEPVNTLMKEIEHQKFLLKLLTKKDSFVRKELMNKNIPFLNKQLRHYLSLLGLSYIVEFTHEMSAKITRFGREMEFGNLSAGQAARVNFALSLAFKDVRERQCNRVNICMLDEVLDHGLDLVGVEAAVALIKHKAKADDLSMYVITHRTEINNMFSQFLTIQMQGGFSSIKESDPNVDSVNL